MKSGGSYEGYVQLLCANGHYWVVDCYQYCTEAAEVCSKCGKPAVWSNQVDLTNGSHDEDTGARIDGYIELEVVKEDKCSKCGQTTEVIYKVPNREIPVQEEFKPMYTVLDEDDGYID